MRKGWFLLLLTGAFVGLPGAFGSLPAAEPNFHDARKGSEWTSAKCLTATRPFPYRSVSHAPELLWDDPTGNARTTDPYTRYSAAEHLGREILDIDGELRQGCQVVSW